MSFMLQTYFNLFYIYSYIFILIIEYPVNKEDFSANIGKTQQMRHQKHHIQY
jgi:hypothetical protein